MSGRSRASSRPRRAATPAHPPNNEAADGTNNVPPGQDAQDNGPPPAAPNPPAPAPDSGNVPAPDAGHAPAANDGVTPAANVGQGGGG